MNKMLSLNIFEATLSEMGNNIDEAIRIINKTAVYHMDRRMTMLNKYKELQNAIRLLQNNDKLICNPNFVNENIIWMSQE